MRCSQPISLLVAALALAACSDETLIDGHFTEAEWHKVASFTLVDAPPSSPTNRMADVPAAARFGQRLWFEKRYAGPIVEGSIADGGLGEIDETQKVSCSSCHDPRVWFSDSRPNNATSLGTAWSKRNSPSMVNAAYYNWGSWAGSHDQQWKQAATVIENRDAFNSTRLRYAHVIYDYYRDDYNALFEDLDPALDPSSPEASRFPPHGKPKPAGGQDGAWEGMSETDRRHVNTIMANCGKAIEAYERLLVSMNAPFDRYVAGDQSALSESAKRGLKLFIGKAACDQCHEGETFTDQEFHNTSVAQAGPAIDLGHFDDVARLDNDFNGAGAFSDDPGAGTLKLNSIERTRSDAMKGQFRTKSLRHIAQTAPYFHNGALPTLESVVRFYNQGGAEAGTFPGEKDRLMVPLNLSDEEVADLVAFLEALTGDPVPEELMQNTSALTPVSRTLAHISAEQSHTLERP